jgi:hypothetical protein
VSNDKPAYRPLEALERHALQALGNVTMPVGSNHKRLVRNIYRLRMITDKQAAYLWSLVWRYRRQIPAADLVEHARRLTQPDVSKGAFLQ